jgi:hypothetical protein
MVAARAAAIRTKQKQTITIAVHSCTGLSTWPVVARINFAHLVLCLGASLPAIGASRPDLAPALLYP